MTRMPAAIEVTEATPADLPEVRAMLREYADWLAIDLSFQDFARELTGLPGEYSRPSGALFIARFGAQAVGIVAFRSRDETTAEMKRLYVRPAARQAGGEWPVTSHLQAAFAKPRRRPRLQPANRRGV
jgi:carbonic anhydrase